MQHASRLRSALAIACAAGTVACAAKQRVPLDCLPAEVVVYVDGERLAETPDALELSADEPHVVMFRGEGYASEMVVLEAETDADGRSKLSPESLCVRLSPIGMDRRLDLTPEEEPPDDHL
jgi:hypothetical protein